MGLFNQLKLKKSDIATVYLLIYTINHYKDHLPINLKVILSIE